MSKNNRASARLPLSVSQNYLTSAATIQRALRQTSLTGGDHVIEIGAGKGHITRELCKLCRSVQAYELDGGLYRALARRFAGESALALRHQDFLKAELPPHRPYKVFSNIPFSITSKIVRKLTRAPNPPLEAWLVMEKGAAMRFAGAPRETVASLSLKPFFLVELVYHFSRRDFHPMPSVDVVLLHLKRKAPGDLPASQRADFIRFLEDDYRRMTKKQVSTALKRAGLPCIGPSGEMLYVQWLCLFRAYQRYFPGAFGR